MILNIDTDIYVGPAHGRLGGRQRRPRRCRRPAVSHPRRSSSRSSERVGERMRFSMITAMLLSSSSSLGGDADAHECGAVCEWRVEEEGWRRGGWQR